MNTVFVLVLAVAILAGCATSSGLFKSGPDTFTVNTSASPGHGGAAPAKKSAYDEANQECAKLHMTINIVA